MPCTQRSSKGSFYKGNYVSVWKQELSRAQRRAGLSPLRIRGSDHSGRGNLGNLRSSAVIGGV